MSAGWLTKLMEPGVVHVLPLEDLIVHDEDDDCVCGPRVELIPPPPEDPDQPDGWMHTHNSLDGREAQE